MNQERGKYVEVPWDFAGLRVVLHAKVRGDEVRSLSCETEDGRPVRIPDTHVPQALDALLGARAKAVSS